MAPAFPSANADAARSAPSSPNWAADVIDYASQLAARPDLAVSWTVRPPLGVAVKAR